MSADRFDPTEAEAKAWKEFQDHMHRDGFIAILRAVEADALERAAQVAKQSQEDCFCKDKSDEKLGGMPCAACMGAARIEGTLRGLAYRALASPAAAPAAEMEPDTIPHMICPACGWSDATLTVATGKLVCHRCDAEREYEPDRVAKIVARYLKSAPPSEPAAPNPASAREMYWYEKAQEAWQARDSAVAVNEADLKDLAATKDRADAAEKRIAELERKAEAWADAIEYCEYSFSPEWLVDRRNRGVFAAHIFRLLDAARAATAKGEGR